MSGLRLECRLGIETVNKLQGCCVDSILAWRPQNIGERHKCIFCDNPMKAIRAAELSSQEWSGMLNEAKFEREAQALTASSLWFSGKRFNSTDAVSKWCSDRGMEGSIERTSDGYRVTVGKSVADTERAVWASPGVLAIFGIAKMDTGSLATGGSLNPLQQGAAAEEETTGKTEKKPDDKCAEKKEVVGELTNLEKALANFDAELKKAIS
jgi:hypothetical protein